MPHRDEDTPAEFDEVVRRLHDERPEVSAFELDELKMRAKRRAMGSPSNGGALRSRFVAGLAVFGLLIGGTGGVIASSGGGGTNGSNSANSQYCPPNSPGAGKPKHQGGGNKCGQPGEPGQPGQPGQAGKKNSKKHKKNCSKKQGKKQGKKHCKKHKKNSSRH